MHHAAKYVAQYLVPCDALPAVASEWIDRVLREPSNASADTFLRELLWSAKLNNLTAVVAHLQENGVLDAPEKKHRLAKHLPGDASGWAVAEKMGGEFVTTYWKTVSLCLGEDSPLEDVAFGIKRLMDAQRPRSAFAAIHFWPDRITPEQWICILRGIARGEELEGPLPEAYWLSEVFTFLDGAEVLSDSQLAELELPYIRSLCDYGDPTHKRILAIHRELARDPALFVQLLCWRYPRRDAADDPEQENISTDQKNFVSDIAFHTLEGWNTVPGCQDSGEIEKEQFLSWAEDALHRATELDRKEEAEIHLGAMLARFARCRLWNNWLPECVLDLLDRSENGSLRERFHQGVDKARSVTSRGPYDGGAQERQLAAHYRDLAARYRNIYPRVSAQLICIAEGYEHYAQQEDDKAVVRERWRG